MQNLPLISIGIPTFKTEFLKECIESVLAQDYNNFEIIIVNDNSPNDVEAVVNQFHDQHIKYYKNDVGFGGYNVIKNWNKCLSYATGEYFICMGDDDMLMPKCLSLYCSQIVKHPEFDIFHIRTEIINEKGEIIDIQEPRPEQESVYSMIWNLWKGRDQFIGDFLFKTQPLKDRGGFYFLPYAWSSDKISAYLAAIDKGIVNISDIGFRYRRSNLTITKSNNSQRERFLALLGEKHWYDTFIQQASLPKNSLDLKFFALIKNGYSRYMNKKLVSMLEWDINESPMHFFFWISNRNKYSLSGKQCMNLFKQFIKSACHHLFHF